MIELLQEFGPSFHFSFKMESVGKWFLTSTITMCLNCAPLGQLDGIKLFFAEPACSLRLFIVDGNSTNLVTELEESGSLTSAYTTKLQSSRQYGTGTKTEI